MLSQQGMVRIVIKLFATLRQGRFSVQARELEAGTTVGMVVGELGIPEREAALIFVNGRHENLATKLADGDTLALFPPVGGG